MSDRRVSRMFSGDAVTMKIWIPLVASFGLLAQTPPTDPGPPPPPLGSVTGHVIDSESKRPIGGAKVEMLDLLHGKNGTTTSGRDGEFHFDQLPAGKYIFEAHAGGYLGGPVPQSDISAGAKLAIEIDLTPESQIEGRVLDDETRLPLAGITVKAVRERRDFESSLRVGEAAHATTNKDGDYQLPRLNPGKYFVVAEPPVADQSLKLPAGQLHPVPTWLPDALHKADAVPVYIAAGHSYGGADIHLRKASGFTISGAISGVPEITAREELVLRLAARDDLLYGERSAEPDRKGMFSFTGVLPGNYTLLLLRKTGEHATPGSLESHLLASDDVLVDKSDVLDLRLPVHWPIAISGSVTVDDSPGADMTGVYVMLAQTGGIVSAGWPTAKLKEDGLFDFPTCDPIHYIVRIHPPNGAYVRSITFNHREVLPSEIIDASGGGGKLDIFLHKGGAELSGTVEQPSSEENTPPVVTGPEARTLAVLIPADWSPDWAIDLPSARIENGAFSIRNVRPGAYSAVALENAVVLWRSPGLIREMQARGETVTLDEDDHVSIHLKLITAAEVQQAALAADQ